MNQAVLADTRDIVIDETFPHAPATLWKTLTTPELMGRWLKMQPVGFEPVVGNRFTYQTTPAGEWDGVIHCEVLVAEPNARLVYSWRGGHASNNGGYGALLETEVSFTLTASDAGTRLHFVHSGFELPRNETAYTNMSNGWHGVLERIDTLTA